jgi:NTP pyrophosphatase (non-canonical NTP hydrolase)
MKERYTFEDLKKIMSELRQKCPWDRKQTHESLKKYLIEETYEVIDAIDKKDWGGLKEELGDLLLQPVFHAKIAEEEGKFNIDDVVDHLCKKLIERHPHVFGEEEAKTAEEVLKNLEKRKLEKRKSVLEGVPKHLPALMRAEKLQKKAAGDLSEGAADLTNISVIDADGLLPVTAETSDEEIHLYYVGLQNPSFLGTISIDSSKFASAGCAFSGSDNDQGKINALINCAILNFTAPVKEVLKTTGISYKTGSK